MVMKNNTKLTSVKLLKSLYENFKTKTVNTKMSLQKLTNSSVDLYLTDKTFQDKVDTYDELNVSGSNW